SSMPSGATRYSQRRSRMRMSGEATRFNSPDALHGRYDGSDCLPPPLVCASPARALGFDLLQRFAGRVRHEEEAHGTADHKEQREQRGDLPDARGGEDGHEKAPDAEDDARHAERDSLGG